MQYIYPCFLRQKVDTGKQDNLGNPIYTESTRKVFVSKKSVRQSEFYKSHQESVLVEKVLGIREVEYKEERKAEIDGELYRILRTYTDGSGELELMLTKVGVENV